VANDPQAWMVETDEDLWATTTRELDGAIWEELSATAELFSVSIEPSLGAQAVVLMVPGGHSAIVPRRSALT